MDAVFEEYQEQDQRKAKVAAIVWLVLLLFVLVYPLMRFEDPPVGQEGILVNLGNIDMGNFDDDAAGEPTTSSETEPLEETPEETPVETPEEVEPEVEPEPEPEPKEKPKETIPTKEKEVIKDNSAEIAIAKAKEKKKEEDRIKKEADKAKKAAEAAKKKLADEKRKAEEAAKKERERKEAEASKLKNQLGGLFGTGSGEGDNNGGGNQGDPNGDPDSSILEGISTGAGKVGGGLAARGGEGPLIKDNSQATGKVVMKVCVDTKGKVIGTPEFTLLGSTTQDDRLIELAIDNAKKWTFKTGAIDKQCGTITYDFKVK